jgi:hypothetical protein
MVNLSNDKDFLNILEKNCKDILTYLVEKKIAFNIASMFNYITFNPELPNRILSKLPHREVIIFAIAYYSLESAYIENNCFNFEAGFGDENFGSLVSMPLDTLIHITVDEEIIFINNYSCNKTDIENKEKKSMNKFLSNPKNKKFLKPNK